MQVVRHVQRAIRTFLRAFGGEFGVTLLSLAFLAIYGAVS
jgi:hypothetical protein